MRNISKVWMLSIVAILFFLFCGCTGSQESDRQAEALVAKQSLLRSRHENASEIPILPERISDIRIEIRDREYDMPDFMEGFQNLDIMQITYGFYSDGTWYDYPSENYNLIGILGHKEFSGWGAAIGSHMVQLGQYLLINICVADNPGRTCEIRDTLGSEILEPFTDYYTYRSYDNKHGYGHLAENTLVPSDSDYIIQYEFPRRYYVLLDYEYLPEDYTLTVTYSTVNGSTESYTLAYEDICAFLEDRP